MLNVDIDELIFEREWRKCFPQGERSPADLADAFQYFCSKYVRISHPARGRISFELRPAQRRAVEAWLEHRYTVSLKARQIGFSTLVSVFCFWLAFGWGSRTIPMISRTEREAKKLLQHAKYAYRFLPEWMRLRGPTVKLTATKIEFSNESVIESLPSASDPARGVTAFVIVVDEIGFLPNSEQAWASIEPVVDVGGRAILLGTANGEGDLLHKLWVGAETGENRFKSMFFGWDAGDRDQAWYEAKKADLPAWQLAREYPSNPDEAFIRSGNPVFDVDLLRMFETVEPETGFLVESGDAVLFDDSGGPLRVFSLPADKGVYVVGADVAQGLGHGDYSSAHVIDARSHEVVAVWHGHIDPDLFGSETLFLLGRFYNNALVGVEVNNHGLTTLKALQRVGYRNIFRQHREGSVNPKKTELLGWRTTSASKPMAIDELVRDLRDGRMGLRCRETLAELRTFVRDADGKMHGSPHDDRVMSLAIANQMLKYVWLPIYRFDNSPPPGTFGYLEKMLYDSGDGGGRRKPIGVFCVRDDGLVGVR